MTSNIDPGLDVGWEILSNTCFVQVPRWNLIASNMDPSVDIRYRAATPHICSCPQMALIGA
jgi:hypothetical protein